MTTNFDDARAAYCALKAFFTAHPKGRLDSAAFQSVQALCKAAERTAPDLECQRAIRNIVTYSALLHSTDAVPRGADFVRLRVQNALACFRSQLKAIEAASDRHAVPL